MSGPSQGAGPAHGAGSSQGAGAGSSRGAAPFQGLFALLNRSLRTEDRSLRTHIYRFIFVLLSYAMLVGAQSGGMWMGAPGLNMFRSMCYLNFFCITVAALSFFAAAITEEKEEMTLGLLKMAGVSSLSLLIGKSTPRLIAALVLLTAQFPFTMLAITLGGVSIHQVLAAYWCLFAFLVFVANLALFGSVICSRSRSASWFTGVFLFFYFFGPTFFTQIKAGFVMKGWWTQQAWLDNGLESVASQIRASSAFTRVGSILQTGFAESAISHQVISNLSLGLAFLLFGWLLFERCTRNEKPPSEARGLLFRRIGAGHSLVGAGRAWNWAICWKDFHFVGGGKIMMMLKFLLYGGILGLIVWSDHYYGGNLRLEDFGGLAMALALTALVAELAIQGSRVFYTELKWKTLSGIMLLPSSVSRIGYSKVAGTAVSLIPAVSMFLLGVACAPKVFSEGLENIVKEPGAWYFVSQVVLFIHLATLLSLYVKWGALPLAFAGIFGGYMLLIFFLTTIFRISGPVEGILGVIAIGSFILCGVSHFVIGARLKHLAAT